MNIFSALSLFGGLAMFLYGMRIMGDSLKESSSGSLKLIMERVTNSPFKAFVLGALVTALIQSSNATIVITAGLVTAGILNLHQSLGIIIGANVGTTITGQIIRLMDVNDSSAAWLQFFKPSTLAPIALIIGIILIMFVKSKNSNNIGQIMMGFGILFTGLMTMTNSVDVLTADGTFDALFENLGNNMFIGLAIGFIVSVVLQSASASIGILQAFSASGKLIFSAVYPVVIGIYIGNGVITAIICSLGAKDEAKRVGIVTFLYNLAKSILILVVMTLLHMFGLIDGLWNSVANAGLIANANTIFNLICALALLPVVSAFEKIAYAIVKQDEKSTSNKYQELFDSLTPNFFATPALALNSTYKVLLEMNKIADYNIRQAFGLQHNFDQKVCDEIRENENILDMMADKISNYLVAMSSHVTEDHQARILDEYYKVVNEFERLGDHALNMVEVAEDMNAKKLTFSDAALKELVITEELMSKILEYTRLAFAKRDLDAAFHIEPCEEVMDEVCELLQNHHIERLRKGECTADIGINFLNLSLNIERISDICSNVGLEVLTRANPDLDDEAHEYMNRLHGGSNEQFNQEFKEVHDQVFTQFEAIK